MAVTYYEVAGKHPPQAFEFRCLFADVAIPAGVEHATSCLEVGQSGPLTLPHEPSFPQALQLAVFKRFRNSTATISPFG